jgi:4-hydroxy-3-methylbut-2-enyl diphosphate reductase
VKGTLGVAPGQVVLVGSVAEAEKVQVPDPSRVAVVTQTTLSIDDTRDIVETLQRRFRAIATPKTDDICYATQNRQNAVKELVEVSDAILVVGSKQSSNANRLVEVARTRGARAFLVDSIADVEGTMLSGVKSLGLTASASSPEWLVEEIIGAFAERGAKVELLSVAKERVHFPLPMPSD